MATKQIEIDIPIFERNMKLYNKKGLRRSFTSVVNHKKEYMVIPPLSSSNEFMMEVTLDKEYAEMFMDLLTSNNLEDLGANPVLHLENLIKDYEANKEAFADKKETFEKIYDELEKRKKDNPPYQLLENDDVKFYFYPYNDKVSTMYDFIKAYKNVILDFAKEKDITIMLRPVAFSNQLEGFFGFNFFDADSKEEVVVDYASRLTVHVDFDQAATVYSSAIILSGIGKSKEELADQDLNVHLISENLKYEKA